MSGLVRFECHVATSESSCSGSSTASGVSAASCRAVSLTRSLSRMKNGRAGVSVCGELETGGSGVWQLELAKRERGTDRCEHKFHIRDTNSNKILLRFAATQIWFQILRNSRKGQLIVHRSQVDTLYG